MQVLITLCVQPERRSAERCWLWEKSLKSQNFEIQSRTAWYLLTIVRNVRIESWFFPQNWT